jgi:tRNA(fMet)-specific endonuclease VapC
MNGKCLLDTNVVIALFDDDAIVLEFLAQVEESCVPSIVIGELYYGARKSHRVQENIQRLQKFTAGNTILNCDVETAPYYGSLETICEKRAVPFQKTIFGSRLLRFSMI